MSRCGPALVILVFAACAIDSGGLRPTRDSGVQPIDARGVDARTRTRDGGPATGTRQDGGRPTDASADARPCAPPDEHAVALWDFESGLPAELIDVAGAHHGTLTSGAIAVTSIPGCGTALGLPASVTPSHGVVPDAADFDLSEGSIDFWVRLDDDATDDGAQMRGIVSRDAHESARPGHVTVAAAGSGTIVFRLQGSEGDVLLCSDPVPRSTWVHVGIVFGGTDAELWVDGVRATRSDSIRVPLLGDLRCGRTSPAGIDGNDNPLVFGAAAWLSIEGSATPVDAYLAPAAIDHVRVSCIRRDFSR